MCTPSPSGAFCGGGGAAPACRPAPPAPEAPPEAPVWRLDLKSNQVDASRFPAAAWARLTRQVLSEDGEALLRPVPHQGLPALRQAIARDLREYKGMAVPPEQIVVGAGAEYLYLLLAQLLGREAVFAVEDPGYPKIRQVYGKCGAACRPVPPGRPGRSPEALEAAGASVVHLSPAHHYPTGLVTPIGRRQACSAGLRRPEASSSRMTMTASSALQAVPFPPSRVSTPPGGWCT